MYSLLLLVFAPSPEYLIPQQVLRQAMPAGMYVFITMTMELVPRELRGKLTGMVTMIQSLIAISAPIIGGYIYQILNPSLLFLLWVAIDVFIMMPILSTIPETLKKSDEKHHN